MYVVSTEMAIIPIVDIAMLSLEKFNTKDFMAYALKHELPEYTGTYGKPPFVYIKTFSDEFFVIDVTSDVNKTQLTGVPGYVGIGEDTLKPILAKKWTDALAAAGKSSGSYGKNVVK